MKLRDIDGRTLRGRALDRAILDAGVFQGLFLQHDLDVANQAGAAFRGDMNNALVSLGTCSSGGSAPATTYAYMLWADTTNGILKQRNAANTNWLPRVSLAEAFVVARSSNTILAATDFGKTFNCTSTFTQTLTAAATLGDGWWCEFRNNGTGVITFDPNSSETIDGQTTLKLLPGESCKIWCNGTLFITIGRTLAKNDIGLLENLGLAVSVAANAITVAIKDAAGNDPAPGSPVRIGFRSATAATGTPDVLEVIAAASVVGSSGSTLGTVSTQAHRIYILGINDAGTFRLGLWNPWDNTNFDLLGINECDLYSSTAEGGAGAADSPQVIYTGSAVTSKAVRILGYFESTQTTAGTWAAGASKIQLMGPGVPRTGDVVQDQPFETGTSATGTTLTPADNSIPQVGEGTEYMTTSFTARSEINLVELEANSYCATSAGSTFSVHLHRNGAADAVAANCITGGGTGSPCMMPIKYRALAGSASAITYSYRVGAATAGTVTFLGAGGARLMGGIGKGRIDIKEIFV